MNLLLEIEKIAQALGDKLPANPGAKQNEKLQNQLERGLKRYFNLLSVDIPERQIEELYNRKMTESLVEGYVEPSVYQEAYTVIEPLIASHRAELRAIVTGHLVKAFIQGDAQLVQWGTTKVTNKPIYYEGPPMQEAVNFARFSGSRLITQMDEATQDRLANIIAEGIQNKRGIPGLISDLKKECRNMGYNPMGTSRATMIARTETCDALQASFVERAYAMGVTGKEWVASYGACDACHANANDGVIPLYSTFSSGDERPPQHPNCMCALAPVMMEEGTPGVITKDQRQAARECLENVKSIQPMVRSDLDAIRQATGGNFAGLNFEFKGEGSTASKLMGYQVQDGYSLQAAKSRIADSLRYTLTYDEKGWGDNVLNAYNQMKQKGYVPIDKKQSKYWVNNIYKGYNTAWKTPTGLNIEVQFHTKESFRIKTANHKDYEKYRHATSPLNAQYYAKRMEKRWEGMPLPEKWDILPGEVIP